MEFDKRGFVEIVQRGFQLPPVTRRLPCAPPTLYTIPTPLQHLKYLYNCVKIMSNYSIFNCFTALSWPGV